MAIKHIGTKNIETERLILRRIEEGDAINMFNGYCTDEEVSKYLTWDVHKSLEKSKNLVSIWIKEYENLNTYRWAICEKENNIIIGTIDKVRANEAYDMAEIGYCLDRKKWNKGYMSEALKSVIDYLFDVGYHRIQALHQIENRASGRVMQKAGMKKEAVFTEAIKNKDGSFHDAILYAIINPKHA